MRQTKEENNAKHSLSPFFIIIIFCINQKSNYHGSNYDGKKKKKELL
jgi:hypothetical protein